MCAYTQLGATVWIVCVLLRLNSVRVSTSERMRIIRNLFCCWIHQKTHIYLSLWLCTVYLVSLVASSFFASQSKTNTTTGNSDRLSFCFIFQNSLSECVQDSILTNWISWWTFALDKTVFEFSSATDRLNISTKQNKTIDMMYANRCQG